jgi:hypothetical protein
MIPTVISDNRNLNMNQSKDILADIAAAGTGVTATWTWITHVNDMLQLVATAVAIVAGVYAIRWHKVRIDTAVKKEKDREQNKSE